MDPHSLPSQLDKLSPSAGGRGHAGSTRLPLTAAPQGLLDRAMAQIRLEAAAGRARPFLGLSEPGAGAEAAPRALPLTPPSLARRRGERREALALLGTLALALLALAGLRWLWLGLDPLQLIQWRLALRQMLFDLRVLAQAQPFWLLGAGALASAFGLLLVSLADLESAALRTVGRQA